MAVYGPGVAGHAVYHPDMIPMGILPPLFDTHPVVAQILQHGVLQLVTGKRAGKAIVPARLVEGRLEPVIGIDLL